MSHTSPARSHHLVPILARACQGAQQDVKMRIRSCPDLPGIPSLGCRRQSHSCPPRLPNHHCGKVDADQDVVRRWAFSNPELARELLRRTAIDESWRAWAAWNSWGSGWTGFDGWHGHGSGWNSSGRDWLQREPGAWVRSSKDRGFLSMCVEAVTAGLGQDAATSALATSWWESPHRPATNRSTASSSRD